MRPCWNDWQPLLSTPKGQRWLRPIGLLGEDDFSVDQDEFTKTPAMRRSWHFNSLKLSWTCMPIGYRSNSLSINARWSSRCPRMGRNETCPCGSGKKFKRCCGAAGDIEADRGPSPQAGLLRQPLGQQGRVAISSFGQRQLLEQRDEVAARLDSVGVGRLDQRIQVAAGIRTSDCVGKNPALLPTTKGQIAFSTGLESKGQVPLATKRMSFGHFPSR
jgi:hypothetical protein